MNNNPITWREAFTFSRSEKRGLLILTALLLLSVIARVIYFRFVPPTGTTFQIPAGWCIGDSIPFDKAMNLKHASTFHFRNDTTNGNIIRKWSRTDTIPTRSYSTPFKRSRVVELNSADTFELKGLPSIGPWLARKILEYREKLGGFYSKDQLLEVYRLSPGKLDTIAPFLVIDTSLVRRIDINFAELEDLLKHPYLSRSQAKGLLAYRQKHGPFGSVSDIKKCLLIDEKTFEKVRDYIEVR